MMMSVVEPHPQPPPRKRGGGYEFGCVALTDLISFWEK